MPRRGRGALHWCKQSLWDCYVPSGICYFPFGVAVSPLEVQHPLWGCYGPFGVSTSPSGFATSPLGVAVSFLGLLCPLWDCHVPFGIAVSLLGLLHPFWGCCVPFPCFWLFAPTLARPKQLLTRPTPLSAGIATFCPKKLPSECINSGKWGGNTSATHIFSSGTGCIQILH